MSEGIKTEVVAARLAVVPWWRTALDRLGRYRERRHHEMLDLLAGRDMTDTIREEDVNAWLAMLEGESRRSSGIPLKP